MKPVHRTTVRVRSYETGVDGRLQVPVLCRLLQEAATIHAAELGVSVESLIEDGCAWVLSRMRVVVHRWPTVDDEVVIETWPQALNRLTTERRFEVRLADGPVLATATTLWLVLDLERRRPIRVPSRIVEALSRHDVGDTPVRAEKLNDPNLVEGQSEFGVRRSDLDLAGHVNNTSYVEWIVEAIPDDLWSRHVLSELDISYLAESHRGEAIVSGFQRRQTADGWEVLHRLTRKGHDGVVARARTSWRSASSEHE
jgi:acyl-ACP thioesterase